MASGGMSNKNTRNLLKLLNGVNFSQFNDNQGQEENSDGVRREYLLGRMIHDILESKGKKPYKIEELHGLTSDQLWKKLNWAKKVEYGATQAEYDTIPPQFRGELQVVSIPEMKLVTNYFSEEVKEAMSKNYPATSAAVEEERGGTFDIPANTGNIRENVKSLHQHVSHALASPGNSLDKRKSIAEMRRMIQRHLAKNLPANVRQELDEIHTMADTYLRDYMITRPRTFSTKKGYKTVTPAAKSQVSGTGNRWTVSKRKTRKSKHRK